MNCAPGAKLNLVSPAIIPPQRLQVGYTQIDFAIRNQGRDRPLQPNGGVGGSYFKKPDDPIRRGSVTALWATRADRRRNDPLRPP